MDEAIENEEKFTSIPAAHPNPKSTTLSFDSAGFSQANKRTLLQRGGTQELTASSKFIVAVQDQDEASEHELVG